MKFLNGNSTSLAILLSILTCLPFAAAAEVISPGVYVDNSDLTLISSRRVSRTINEYTVKGTVKNSGPEQYRNVAAELTGVPAGISIIDGNLSFGDLDANGSMLSSDLFIIQLNLRSGASLSDLVWQVEGELVVPEPPPSPPPSATGIFMKVDDFAIRGEVSSKSHKDWIELLSWADSASVVVEQRSGGGSGAGKLTLGEVAVSKYVDAASPALRLALSQGQVFEEIQIDIIKSCHGNLYTQYAITLFDPIFSVVAATGSEGNSKQLEDIAINVAAMESSYTPVGVDCKLEQPIFSYQDFN